MSETVIKVSLNELNIVRVTCKNCGVATEFPIEKLPGANLATCPHCRSALAPSRHNQNSDANSLASAIFELNKLPNAKIEFVLLQPSPK